MLRRGINLREAREEDLDGMVALLGQLFQLERDFEVHPMKQRSGLHMLLEDKRRAHVLVAEKAEQIVGMCTVQLLISSAEGGYSAMLEDVVVDEAYRGKQVGSRLLREAERWALRMGAKRLEMRVDMDNTAAQGFYEKRQWEKTNLQLWRQKQQGDSFAETWVQRWQTTFSPEDEDIE